MRNDLKNLVHTPLEEWPRHIKLKAVSANSRGMVFSGILKSGKHFYRRKIGGIEQFVIEGSDDGIPTEPAQQKIEVPRAEEL